MNREMNHIQRIVIKIGTSSLTFPNGALNFRQIETLCEVTTTLRNSGKDIIIVTSGAIGAGMGKLKLNKRPVELEMKQACASVGQAYLIQIYQNFYSSFDQQCAQILLTKDVVTDDLKRMNAMRTFSKLFELGVIPIVNENDAISTDEIEGIKFSDNDNLSAVVCELTHADLLIILSDIEGLYEKKNGVLTNHLISYVNALDASIMENVDEKKSTLGTGGMSSKLNAISQVMKHGMDAIICSSKDIRIIYDCVEGKNIGTYFKGGVFV